MMGWPPGKGLRDTAGDPTSYNPSTPDPMLRLLSRYAAASAAAPLYLLEVGATDGMSRGLPDYEMLRYWGWRGLLVEADPRAFQRLQQRFAGLPHVALRRGALAARRDGFKPGDRAREGFGLPLHQLRIDDSLTLGAPPSTGSKVRFDLPLDAQEFVASLSSFDATYVDRLAKDYHVINKIIGSKVEAAHTAAGRTERAAALLACRDKHVGDKPCYNVTRSTERVEAFEWTQLLAEHRLPTVDLLVLDVYDNWGDKRTPRDGSWLSTRPLDLLNAFPFESARPALILFRHQGNFGHEMVAAVVARGYETSSHFETPYWGECTLAWDVRACESGAAS